MAKKKRVPWGTVAWGSIAGALLWRTFYRPSRAIVQDGFVRRCAGKTSGVCSTSMAIESFEGAGPVYTPVAGRVLSVGALAAVSLPGIVPQTVIRVAATHEPVILEYRGAVQPQVSEGEKVGVGQQIALAQSLEFSVQEIRRTATGTSPVQLEPASWLAARGYGISVKKHEADTEGENWCEGGRKLRVPESAVLCNLELPAPGGLLLLPVSVGVERGV